MVFNPSSMVRLGHTLLGAWQSGAFLILSISAYYLLKKKHEAFATASLRIGLILAVVASVGSLVSGHRSGQIVAEHQPAKLAAMEGHYPASEPAALTLFGWVDEENERTVGPKFPGLLSFLVYGSPDRPITGLNAFAPEDRPPVQPVFQSFHLMVAVGTGLLALSLIGLFYWWRGRLSRARWLLWLLVFSVLGPHLANQLGWVTAEIGRQPWIVHGLMRTEAGVSPSVSAVEVWVSLIMFTAVYVLLFVLFIFLLDRKIKHGPLDEDLDTSYQRA
jgi:cytochrome d ubiquinol oxidase subunit I